MKWEIDTLNIKLSTPWKINGVEIAEKKLYIVKFTKGDYFGRGEVSYGSREDINFDDLKEDITNFSSAYTDADVIQFTDLTRLLDGLDFFVPRIRVAIETAFLNYLYQATEIEPWRIMGTNTIKMVNSVTSIPLFDTTNEAQEILSDIDHSTTIVKFKISKETIEKQLEFINSYTGEIVLDANESWEGDLSGFLEVQDKLTNSNILFIEQPFGKNDLNLYKEIKDKSKFEIFLDESFQDHKHLSAFEELCHGVVIKTCKSNGLMRVVNQMTQAKKSGLKTMLGCMVESSVGISSLFYVAYGFDYYDFDGFTKLENDPFEKVFWDNGKVCLSTMN